MFREGEQIGPYILIRKLGKGGFGIVWLAEKRSQFLAKKVAVKLLDSDQVNFETIQREAVLWEEASGHPNVLPIIDAEIYGEQVVIVSEYAEGGSLYDRLKAAGVPPLETAFDLTIGILSGLDYLHRKKIIHRDIKPQNILLQGETPRLADFGISRAMQTSSVSSTVIGTDAYMSPESFEGKRSIQTDLWSVGVVLYLLVKGNLPFPQEHPSERMFAVLMREFDPLPENIPGGLRNIISTALAKQPENRFQSAAEMRKELKRLIYTLEPRPNPEPETPRIPISIVTTSDPPEKTTDEPDELETKVAIRSDPTNPPKNAEETVVANYGFIDKGILHPTNGKTEKKKAPGISTEVLVGMFFVGIFVLGGAIVIGGALLARPKPAANNFNFSFPTFTPIKTPTPGPTIFFPAANSTPSPSKSPTPPANVSKSTTLYCDGYIDGYNAGWDATRGKPTPRTIVPCPSEFGVTDKTYLAGRSAGYSEGARRAKLFP